MSVLEKLTAVASRHYLLELREARALVLSDAEGYAEAIFAIERLGSFLKPDGKCLADYRTVLLELAKLSPLATDPPDDPSSSGNRFSRLFELIRRARNDAMHQGAAARNLATHNVQVLLILEDALLAEKALVEDVMVDAPREAKLFEPLASIRRSMLSNAFTFLPVCFEGSWKLLHDVDLARFLAGSENAATRRKRLAMCLEQAIVDGGLKLRDPVRCATRKEMIVDVIKKLSELPILVVDSAERRDGQSDLVGILTASDLL